MRLVQFYKASVPDRLRLGLEIKHEQRERLYVDLSEHMPKYKSSLEFIEAGALAIKEVNYLLETQTLKPLSPDEVKLSAPIHKVDKVLCTGMNYVAHIAEQNFPTPELPIFFSKFSSCICGPFDDIPYPDITTQLDFEVELAVVIGKAGKNIPQQQAMDYVFGYTVVNDLSARDWQLGKKNGGQWLLGKAMDHFCPIGPVIVSKEEIQHPSELRLTCTVNEVLKQDSTVSDMLFPVDHLIAHASQFFTLLPGDLILTGTPSGTGVFRDPPEFLRRGDDIKCEISVIGEIRNKIV